MKNNRKYSRYIISSVALIVYVFIGNIAQSGSNSCSHSDSNCLDLVVNSISFVPNTNNIIFTYYLTKNGKKVSRKTGTVYNFVNKKIIVNSIYCDIEVAWPNYSPNRKYIAFGAEGVPLIFLRNTYTGDVITLNDEYSKPKHNFTFSPDGRYLFYISNTGVYSSISAVKLETKEIVNYYPKYSQMQNLEKYKEKGIAYINNLQISKNGKFLYFIGLMPNDRNLIRKLRDETTNSFRLLESVNLLYKISIETKMVKLHEINKKIIGTEKYSFQVDAIMKSRVMGDRKIYFIKDKSYLRNINYIQLYNGNDIRNIQVVPKYTYNFDVSEDEKNIIYVNFFEGKSGRLITKSEVVLVNMDTGTKKTLDLIKILLQNLSRKACN